MFSVSLLPVSYVCKALRDIGFEGHGDLYIFLQKADINISFYTQTMTKALFNPTHILSILLLTVKNKK